MREVNVLSDFLDLFIIFTFLLSFRIISSSSFYPSTSPRLSSKSPVHFAKEMGSTDESFSNTTATAFLAKPVQDRKLRPDALPDSIRPYDQDYKRGTNC